MKYVITVAIAALSLLTVISCSPSGNKIQNGVNDTLSPDVTEAIQDSADVSMPYLTPEGLIYEAAADSLHNIRIGLALDSLPPVIPGLYNRMVRDASEDAEILSCYSGTDKLFEIYSFDSGTVDMISLTSPLIKGVGNLQIGMRVKELFKLSSQISTEWVSIDDTGRWYWRVNGLWILPEDDNITDKIKGLLTDHRMPPSLSALPPETKITYIATGLPF